MNEFNQRVREALTGPICSLPTPFAADETIDYRALGGMIDFQLASGFGVIFLTPGNSHFNCLADAEIAELCRFTVDAVGGRALTVVGSFSRGTAATLAGARYARECGADLFLPFPPNWAGSCTAGTLIDYFTAVAAEMPLLLIYPALGAVPESTTVIEEVQRRTGGRVAAVKDDLCQPISRRMTAALSGECAVFSGGQKQNFLNIRPYGAVGYLSTIGMFRPEVAREFYRALEEGNERRAVELILTVDMPFFDALLACPGSFDAGIHAVMEMYGFCSRHRRAPYYDLTDAEVEELREKIHHIGLI